MSINSTAIRRGALLAKESIAKTQRQAIAAVGKIKIAEPNRAMRRAAKKKEKKQ